MSYPQPPKKRTASLRAKADRLQRKIDNTENAGLIEALIEQREVVNTLSHSPLTDTLYHTYEDAKDKKSRINLTFLEEIRKGTHKPQFAKIYRTLRAEIYAPES